MRMARKEERRIIWLAYFVRYGYWAFYLLALHILRETSAPKALFTLVRSAMPGLFGLYLLTGLHFRFRHLYCAMQEAYRMKMTPRNGGDFTKEMKRDIRFIGWLFFIMGFLLEAAFYLDI